MRTDVLDPFDLNIRFATGQETGANSFWVLFFE